MPDDNLEQQLVARAQQGEQNAFENLFLGLRERLLALIRLRLVRAACQHVDPEDLLHASYVKALGSIARFEWRGEESFRHWLESIAMHVTLDAIRSHGRKPVLSIDREVEGVGTSPSQSARRRERLRRLEASLRTLSPDHQLVLRLSRMEGLPVKEIALRMDRSESAVKNLLLRATRQLRESFGDTESLHLGDGRFGDPGTTHDA